MDSEKSSVESSVEMVPQPHGGALLPGAGAGKQPGAGRPSNELRNSLRGILEDGLPNLRNIANGAPRTFVSKECKCGETVKIKLAARDTDQLRALEIASKYGLNDTVEEDFVREMAAVVGEVLKQAEGGDELLDAIYEGWKPVIAKRL